MIAMRERGLTVHASDIEDRGCPDSTVLDFLDDDAAAVRAATCCCRIRPIAEAMESSSTPGRSDSAWSILLLKRQFRTRPSATNACTSAAICAGSTSWPSGFRTCMTPPISPRAARKPDRARITPGSCSIAITAGRATINPVSINRPSRAHAVADRRGLRAMRQALSAAAIEFAVLRRYLSPARPSRRVNRDKP